ncbi:hypothetical protein TSAR_014318 [Trichomalopsis sarcophagae]|uniref:Uncharacterized protein n=1 Tax=Trichomalopsis sarcophagae TaxID=543379 RepID=A0A232FE95_9HYME|nr:hypothetical protein TSAR_014318 [Trichomalopsis sarcophagae]
MMALNEQKKELVGSGGGSGVKNEAQYKNTQMTIKAQLDSSRGFAVQSNGGIDLVIDLQFFKDHKGLVVPKKVGLAVLNLDTTAYWIITPTFPLEKWYKTMHNICRRANKVYYCIHHFIKRCAFQYTCALNNACKLKLWVNLLGTGGDIISTAERPFSPPYYLYKNKFTKYPPKVTKNKSSCSRHSSLSKGISSFGGKKNIRRRKWLDKKHSTIAKFRTVRPPSIAVIKF